MNQVQEYVQEKFIGGRIFRLIERYGIANGVPFYSIQRIIHHQIQGVFEERIIKIYNLINGEYEFTNSISDFYYHSPGEFERLWEDNWCPIPNNSGGH